MENEELLQEEETNLITLTDENGVDMEFEYLDCIAYQGKEYLVLIPNEEDADELVILVMYLPILLVKKCRPRASVRC